MHNCLICFFVCCFSISVPIVWISYFVLILFIEVFFFNFVLQLEFLICFVFHFSPHSFLFFILFLFLL
jgi:hypothetical protein